MKNKTYLCSYSTGEYEDYREYNIFITKDIEKAKTWVIKINNLAKKGKNHLEEMRRKGFYVWKSQTYIFNSFNCAEYNEIESR